MSIIGLCGYAGSGKDTVADIFVKRYHYKQMAFADKVTELAYSLNTYLPEVNMRYRDIIVSHGGGEVGYNSAKRTFPCVRHHIINIAETCKTTLGDDVWVDQVLPPIDRYAYFSSLPKRVVISDVRHNNEAARIRKYGGIIIYIDRPGVEPFNDAERENIAKIQPDLILVNDSDLQKLRDTIRGYIDKYPNLE